MELTRMESSAVPVHMTDLTLKKLDGTSKPFFICGPTFERPEFESLI